MASPNMLKQKTTAVRQRPGHIASRGAISMYWRPSRLSIDPQLGTSGGSPKPRKLSEASAMITPPMVIEKMTMTGAMMLGRTCRISVAVVGLPIARAGC